MRAVDNQYQQKLGEKFLLQYDEGCDVWSDEEQMRAFAPFALLPPDSPVPDARVVDLGAGRGRDALYFLKLGFKVTALDLFRMPEWGAIETEHPGAIDFIPQSVLNYAPSVGLEHVALVIDNGCYHHQAKNVQSDYLRKVHAILSPRGRFAINVFVCRGKRTQETVFLKDGRLVHIYDESKIRAELFSAGFLVFQTKMALRHNSNFAYDYLYVNAKKIGQ